MNDEPETLAQRMLHIAIREVQDRGVTTWDDIGLLESLAAAAGLSQQQFFALLDTLPSVKIQYGQRMNPLERGFSRAATSRNIEIEREHGKPAGQAAAIAYDVARKAYRQQHPRGPLPKRLRRKNPAAPKKLYRVKYRHRGKVFNTEVNSISDEAAERYVTGPLFKRRLPAGAELLSLREIEARPAQKRKKKVTRNRAGAS